MDNLDGVILTPLNVIKADKGAVMHILKKSESSFNNFGEAYFSTIDYNSVKGWKRHKNMILNLVVPVGEIKFYLFDSRTESKSFNQSQSVIISPNNYFRLTVPPGIWVAFKGLSENLNMLINIASIEHDPNEAENLPLVNELIPIEL